MRRCGERHQLRAASSICLTSPTFKLRETVAELPQLPVNAELTHSNPLPPITLRSHLPTDSSSSQRHVRSAQRFNPSDGDYDAPLRMSKRGAERKSYDVLSIAVGLSLQTSSSQANAGDAQREAKAWRLDLAETGTKAEELLKHNRQGMCTESLPHSSSLLMHRDFSGAEIPSTEKAWLADLKRRTSI